MTPQMAVCQDTGRIHTLSEFVFSLNTIHQNQQHARPELDAPRKDTKR